MKKTKNPQDVEERLGLAHHKRWRRNGDGTYRYVGVCPFNRAVCWMVNAFTQKKARQEEG